MSLGATLMHLPHVPRHILLAFEGLTTHATKKEPLIAVHMPLVNLKVAAVGKSLLANAAAVSRVRGDAMTNLNML